MAFAFLPGRSAAVDAGVEFEVPDSLARAVVEFGHADVIVDALLGIGLRGEPRDPHASLIEAILDADAFVVSADVPSGDPIWDEA